MALQNSGAISISDIKTELGSTSNSLTTLSVAAGKTAPHAMSEFYGYSHYTNTHYVSLDGVNDYVGGDWNSNQDLVNRDWSISCWVRNNESSATNMVLWDFNNTAFESGNNDNRVFLSYSQNVNRFVARVRTRRVNFDRQWALHSNNGVTGTGTSSGDKWVSSNRGNVNGDNFCHLVVTYDASQTTGTNALKIYWNGSELTSQAASNNGSRTQFNSTQLALGAGISNSTAAGTCNIDMDEWALYSDILTSSEVSTLYNSGTIVSPHTLHTSNLVEVIQFGDSGDTDTYGAAFGGAVVGGNTNTY